MISAKPSSQLRHISQKGAADPERSCWISALGATDPQLALTSLRLDLCNDCRRFAKATFNPKCRTHDRCVPITNPARYCVTLGNIVTTMVSVVFTSAIWCGVPAGTNTTSPL